MTRINIEGMHVFDLHGRCSSPLSAHVWAGYIGRALGHLNRYTGHTEYPYSVAEHCLLMVRFFGGSDTSSLERVDRQLALLVHDAHEAFFGDISQPLKTYLLETGSPIRAQEGLIEQHTLRCLGLPDDLVARHELVVKTADQSMAQAEMVAFGKSDAHLTLIERKVLTELHRRRSLLQRAHHSLGLAFDSSDVALDEKGAGDLFGIPRSEIRFGWPAGQAYTARLRELLTLRAGLR